MLDAYVLIDGIPGESTADGYADHIQIVGFNHSIAQSANLSASTAGGATTGRCTHGDFNITKELDKASALLNQHCSSGKHIPSIKMVLVRSGGDGPVEYMEYKLGRCIVSSVGISGMGGSDSIPMENVTFNYGTIEWTYTQIDANTGDKGGVTTGVWNLMTNKAKL